MVGLAKKFREAPFHVVNSFLVQAPKEFGIEMLEAGGWKPAMENISVRHQALPPEKVPMSFVPFYLLFDHTGKLRFYHMAGRFEGGNGDTFKKQVATLLDEAAAP